MEDMTLDEFKQYVLFQIINVKLSERVRWIAVDGNGKLYAHITKPIVYQNSDVGLGWWESHKEPSYVVHTPSNEGGIVLKLPDNIKWTDCIWKL